MELNLSISLNSDKGCVRTNNEDMVLISGEMYRDVADTFSAVVQSNGRFMAAVADGMGGHNAGEIASEITLRAFDNFIIGLPDGLPDSDFRHEVDLIIKKIHCDLIEYGISNAGCDGLGTTLVAWLTYGNRIYLINSGDSRVYRMRNGFLCLLTSDHSEQNRNNDPNLPSNLIYNCLGGGGYSAFADIVDISSKVFNGDIFLLCSDGISDMLSDDEIEKILSGDDNADCLIEAAKKAGGKDNASAVVLKINKIS